jgi:protein-S-isoprenylcysteine O-methyltransferase Ste14
VFPLLSVTLGCWVLLEVSLLVRDRLRDKGSRDRDRATRVLIRFTIGGAIGGAIVAASSAPSLRIPVPHRVPGVIVMWLGLAIRVWAIAALGSAFRTTVEVDPGQAVVSHGPYMWIRHPSYTGLLLIVGGFGLALGNWLALAACLLVPSPAIGRRIRVEEAELDRVLGDPYRAYQRKTKRLIPGVW